jgi:hypothetical protein
VPGPVWTGHSAGLGLAGVWGDLVCWVGWPGLWAELVAGLDSCCGVSGLGLAVLGWGLG